MNVYQESLDGNGRSLNEQEVLDRMIFNACLRVDGEVTDFTDMEYQIYYDHNEDTPDEEWVRRAKEVLQALTLCESQIREIRTRTNRRRLSAGIIHRPRQISLSINPFQA
jgi:hypothetical protein